MAEKSKRKRRKKPAGVVLFSWTVLLITAFVVFRFEAIASSAWDMSSGGSGTVGSIASDYKVGYEDQTSFYIGDGFVLKSGDGQLKLFDESAQPVWEKPLHGKQVMIDGNADSIAVVEPTAGDLFLLSAEGEIKAKRFGIGQIKTMLHPSADYLVCQMVEKNELLVFDGDLESYARIPMPDGELLDLDVSKTASLVAVTMFRLEDETYHSQILTYGLDGQAIGAINLKNKIILDLAVVGDTMIGVTDEQVFAYNISNELQWEYNVDRAIKKAIVSEDGTTVLNLIKSGADLTDPRPENVLEYVKDGEKLHELPLDFDIESMKRCDGRTVFATADRLYILSEKGNMESILDTGGNLRQFDFLDAKHLSVEFGDRLDIMKMN